MMGVRYRLTWLVIACVVGWSRPSMAADSATAEALFREGKALLDGGETEAACEKFQASIDAEPSVGAQLNLARCHEQLGRTASAWAEYVKAAALAQRHGDERREQGARALAAELEPRLSRLTVEVVAPAEGLTVRLGSRVLPASSWGSALPVDPGSLVVEADAPGKEPWRGEVTLHADGDRKLITIPPLEDAAAISPPIDSGDGSSTGELTGVGIAVAVVGLAVVGVGVGLGVKALSDANALEETCPSRECTGAEAQARAIEPWAHGSTAAIAIGAVAAVSGVVLIVVDQTSEGDTALLPSAGPRGAGLWLRQRF
jgi:hypothetical protein